MPTLIGFDTATERVSVALLVEGRTLRRDAPGGAQASATLLPAVHALLAEAGVALAQLDAIAFGRGPGAFTGLRTACAVAQGLALGLDRPVLPVDTLLVVAEDARARLGTAETAGARAGDGDWWAVLDARMGECYAAAYRHRAGAWSTLAEPHLAAPPALVARLAAEAASMLAPAAPRVAGAAALPGVTHPAEPAADALLRIAAADHAAGRGIDAALALPLYVRDKVAQTMAERAAAGATPA